MVVKTPLLNRGKSVSYTHLKISKVIKIIVPTIYCFTATFVVLVYVSIVIPMMSVISNL